MTIQNEPLVSVIIAFLNEQLFLEEAINSVIQQDYNHWELLLVDDGSTDNSTNIALKFASDFKGKIIYCEHEGHINKGLSASRNRGIELAKGTLIAYLDADDIWMSAKLSKQVGIFQSNPDIGMIAEASKYWHNWNNKEMEDVIIPVGAEQDKAYEPPQLIFELYPLGVGAAPCPSALILKKEAIEKAGCFEESFIKEFSMYEDQAFLSKIYLQEKVYISSSSNNLYRQRVGSIVQTVRKSGQYDKVRLYYLEWLEAYLYKKQIKDKRLQRLLKKAFFPYRHPTVFFFTYTIRVKALKLYEKAVPGTIKQLIGKSFNKK